MDKGDLKWHAKQGNGANRRGRTKDIIVAEKLEVLEGGTLGLYGKPNDIDPFVIVSPHNYREIILNPPVYDK